MSTNIYYSGTENKTHFNCAKEAGCKRMLMSYFYLRKSPDVLKARKDKFPEITWLLDSGAHTLMKDETGWSPSDFDRYVNEYADWLDRNREYFDIAVELDIENVVGYDRVKRWQEKLFYPLERDGLSIVYVWHQERGIEEWERMAKKHEFLGVNMMQYKQLPQLFNAARAYMCRVHGFAVTREESLMKWPFATADSTTWKAGERFGDFYFWDNMHMQLFKDKQYRRRYKTQIEALGVNWARIEEDDNYELSKHNAIQFLRMEADCASRTSNNNYWTRRLPRPSEVEGMTVEQVLPYMTWLRLPTDREYEKGASPVDDALQLSRLQWGYYKDFVDDYTDDWLAWMTEEYDDNGNCVTRPEPDEATFDEWRKKLNGRMLEGMRTKATKRSSAEDFKPSRPVKRRPVEYDEVPMTEEIDLPDDIEMNFED